jgi:hypothetical protein
MLQQLARWPASRIAALWIAYVVVAAVLYAICFDTPPPDADLEQIFGEPSTEADQSNALSPAARDSLEALLFAALRTLARDSFKIGNAPPGAPLADSVDVDSLFRAFVVSAPLTPAQRDSMRMFAESALSIYVPPIVQGITRRLFPFLLVLVLFVYGVPLGLLGLTVCWFVARHRYPTGRTQQVVP